MVDRARRWIAAGAALAALATAAVVPSAAAAQDFSSGGPNWYMDAMKLAPIHDAGITGEGVTIAVFDGGLYLEAPTLQGADIEVPDFDACHDPLDYAPTQYEELQHGTSVTSLIVGNGTSESGEGPKGIAPDVDILYYGALQGGDSLGQSPYTCKAPFEDFLDDAVSRGADIVTMSGGTNFLVEELAEGAYEGVARALRAGVVIVTGLPNNDDVWANELDAANGVISVASVDAMAAPAKKKYSEEEMADPNTDVTAPGIGVAGVGFNDTWGMTTWQGNSAATPLVAGLIALGMQKWPDATAAQLTQSLIHNTGSTPHELERSDRFGYGIVNATRFIAEDPTQYPDEHPLFVEEHSPSFDAVYNPPSPTPTAEPVAPQESRLPMVLVSLAIVAVLALAAVAGVIILIVIIVKRRRRAPDQD
jgi:subtilisin family serine protease